MGFNQICLCKLWWVLSSSACGAACIWWCTRTGGHQGRHLWSLHPRWTPRQAQRATSICWATGTSRSSCRLRQKSPASGDNTDEYAWITYINWPRRRTLRRVTVTSTSESLCGGTVCGRSCRAGVLLCGGPVSGRGHETFVDKVLHECRDSTTEVH